MSTLKFDVWKKVSEDHLVVLHYEAAKFIELLKLVVERIFPRSAFADVDYHND